MKKLKPWLISKITPFYYAVDVAVIDEIQMLRCPERGWAWTRALLGIPAKEIHLCGEPAGLEIVKKMLKSTKDTLEVRSFGNGKSVTIISVFT